MNRWVGSVAVAAAVVALVAGGCSSKRRGDLSGETSAGLGEEALDTEGSLARARAGQFGLEAGQGGPLKDVYFDYDSFDLDETSRQTLQENAHWLKDHPGGRVEVEGHCDDRGTVEYNLALGAKRAAAAKNYLVALGVASERMTTISYGEELPLCQEQTDSCWSRNRRAHFAVVGD